MRKRFAKILATVGPASAAPENLRLLHDVGVDAFVRSKKIRAIP